MTTIDLRRGRWQDTMGADVVDAMVCDPPYGRRTHEGHDAVVASDPGSYKAKNGRTRDDSARRALGYASWDAGNVEEFVSAWRERVRGWWVCFTSHDLASVYQDSFERAGLYSFAPLPFFSPGRSVRLGGDGPSSWTDWIMVARPRRLPYSKWGTLHGGYVVPPERGVPVVGAKPFALMRAIVRDYTRHGDVVADPFCGSGTTAVACRAEGRSCITTEELDDHYKIARRRFDAPHTQDMFT